MSKLLLFHSKTPGGIIQVFTCSWIFTSSLLLPQIVLVFITPGHNCQIRLPKTYILPIPNFSQTSGIERRIFPWRSLNPSAAAPKSFHSFFSPTHSNWFQKKQMRVLRQVETIFLTNEAISVFYCKKHSSHDYLVSPTNYPTIRQ